MLSAPHLVTRLLRARRWAIDALSGAAVGADVPDLSPADWQLFLSLERCGSLLLSRLGGGTRGYAGDALRTVAATESQSALQARAEGRILSGIASRLAFPVVVLKGGVRAVSGASPALPLVDLDLLVQREHVETLAAELQRAGFGDPARASRYHQGITPAEGRLAVEVHWTTHDDGRPVDSAVWQRLRPIPGAPNLLQLSARDNLEHLLRHAVILHRERSVSLRDVALAGFAILECSDTDLHSVRASIASETLSEKLDSLLSFATAIAGGSAPVSDPFIREAATFYSSAVTRSRITSPAARAFMMEIALGRSTPGEAAARALAFRGSRHQSVERLARRFPRAGSALAGFAHAAYYSAVTVLSLPRIRRTASQALTEPARQIP